MILSCCHWGGLCHQSAAGEKEKGRQPWKGWENATERAAQEQCQDSDIPSKNTDKLPVSVSASTLKRHCAPPFSFNPSRPEHLIPCWFGDTISLRLVFFFGSYNKRDNSNLKKKLLRKNDGVELEVQVFRTSASELESALIESLLTSAVTVLLLLPQSLTHPP